MSDKITGPLFKWFGSKWLSSKTLPHPEYDAICEPFAGGAGYSLRYNTKKVFIAETNQHLFNLWHWLVGPATEDDIRSIPINIPEGTDIRTLGLSDGQALLLKNWQRTNNVGDCWTISPWGNKPGQWTANTRARVSAEVHLIKHWRVFSDASVLLDALSPMMRPMTWFLDPPYIFNISYGCRPDYNALAQQVRKLPGQVIVCEAVCPKTDKVPDWLPFEFFGSRITSRRQEEHHHHSKELIYHRHHKG